MFFILIMAMVIIVTAFYFTTVEERAAAWDDETRAIAQNMVYHHSAAAKACVEGCSTGTVDVENFLSSTRSGNGIHDDGRLRSINVGAYVVTYFDHGGVAARASEYNSMVGAALRELAERDSGAWTGNFVASSRRLDTFDAPLWRHPETGSLVTATITPVTIPAGFSIPDGAPVIASRR